MQKQTITNLECNGTNTVIGVSIGRAPVAGNTSTSRVADELHGVTELRKNELRKGASTFEKDALQR